MKENKMSTPVARTVSMTVPVPNKKILDIASYVGGRSMSAHTTTGVRTHQQKEYVKLSSNENPHGPSPAVRALLQHTYNSTGTTGDTHRYPDGKCSDLRQAIGNVCDIPMDNIVCGAGSDELIGLLCKAYCAEDDEVVYSQHGFLMYKISALAVGAVPVIAPEKNLTTDVDAILGCVSSKTKIVFVANPNNPTGTWIPRSEIERLVKALPPHVILALDSAYCEYMDDTQSAYTNGQDMVEAHQNVVMLRTFSKIYGIAGLRLGWMYASSGICDIMNRIRGPFNVSAIAQAAGIAAVQDQTYVAACRSQTIYERKQLTQSLSDMGFDVVPSQGNFILIKFHNTGCSADQADQALDNGGIIVRRMESYGLDNCLRITIGLPEDNLRIVDIFKKLSK